MADADDDLDPEQGAEDHHVPGDLLELHEVLEWEAAQRSTFRQLTDRAAPPVAGSFVTRAQWGARAPRSVTRLSGPRGVTWHYEGPPMGVFPHTACATKVRGIQAFHMDGRGWSDIAYTHLVCPHGVVFEGRGAGVRTAANGTNTGNSLSLAVCALLGVGDPHPLTLFFGLDAARRRLMSAGTGAETWVHRDWKATACPGDPITRWHRAGDHPPNIQEDPLMAITDADAAALVANAKRAADAAERAAAAAERAAADAGWARPVVHNIAVSLGELRAQLGQDPDGPGPLQPAPAPQP
jgi:hypothetical protein